ncbi:hypothetical protein T492DRAFT_238892 [Pavlovales sp. CCMP2436]|nr:hypothetical protein T492DRAFT_238892 [Pavlovales sp. CCMP2436]
MVRDKGASGIACAAAISLAASGAAAERGGVPAFKVPHVLLCHVSRSVLDVNRSSADGASCPRGRAVWEVYHALLDRALATASQTSGGCGRACFVDFHAQAHFNLNGGHDLIEVGYLLPLRVVSRAAELLDSTSEVAAALRDASSLRNLWRAHCAGETERASKKTKKIN